ncbi:MAG TPA: DUF2088 domain-containing protein [Firmicutes bacterium]|nr:DUF2088 domain-containing protein [Bacillota bacterium]
MVFPKMYHLKQKFGGSVLKDIPGEVAAQLQSIGIAENVKPGETVAITVGSRGINNIFAITKAVVDEFKRLGLKPFIVPAMGSHGGATGPGQKEVVAHYGITEESVGCPIKSDMDVVEVARSKEGIISYVDKNAMGADHIVVVNRIKPHTEFTGKIESGLAKMLCIGLGKHKGAQHYHQAGVNFGLEYALRTGAEAVIANSPVLCGMGIVENGYDETALIKALPPEEIISGEEALLEKAKEWMPKLPFMQADILIVDEIGKNISGSGMDTKVVGRIMSPYSVEPSEPKITRICLLGVTEASEGNAIGMGLADFTNKRVVETMVQHPTYINANTAQSPQKGRIPVFYDTDRIMLEEAFQTIGLVAPEKARVIRIQNTLHLSDVMVSEVFLPEVESRDDLTLVGGPEELQFDENDMLVPYRPSAGH